MTQIDLLERDIIKTEGQKEYSGALIAALGDPSKWKYTDKCIDGKGGTNYCACGHSIRYIFVIENNGKYEYLGSECIKHFKQINPDLYARLSEASDKLQAELSAARKLAREAQQCIEIAALETEFDRLWDAVADRRSELLERRVYIEYELYRFGKFHKSGPPEYTKKGLYVKWYKDHTAKLIKFIENCPHLRGIKI